MFQLGLKASKWMNITIDRAFNGLKENYNLRSIRPCANHLLLDLLIKRLEYDERGKLKQIKRLGVKLRQKKKDKGQIKIWWKVSGQINKFFFVFLIRQINNLFGKKNVEEKHSVTTRRLSAEGLLARNALWFPYCYSLFASSFYSFSKF